MAAAVAVPGESATQPAVQFWLQGTKRAGSDSSISSITGDGMPPCSSDTEGTATHAETGSETILLAPMHVQLTCNGGTGFESGSGSDSMGGGRVSGSNDDGSSDDSDGCRSCSNDKGTPLVYGVLDYVYILYSIYMQVSVARSAVASSSTAAATTVATAFLPPLHPLQPPLPRGTGIYSSSECFDSLRL